MKRKGEKEKESGAKHVQYPVAQDSELRRVEWTLPADSALAPWAISDRFEPLEGIPEQSPSQLLNIV